MVAFSSIILAASAIAGALASPTLVEGRSPADFVMRRNSNLLRARQSPNYDQDYTTGGTVDYSPNGDSFTVNWDTSDDFVVGVGWTTGSTTPITFDGTFSVGSGTGLLSVYGWTENPLVEYYIIEANSNPPSFGTEKGSLTSDGSSYTIWENLRSNDPSIIGTATFEQYISVRSSQRTSGTVTLENHFNAWAALGLDLGSFYYQVIAVEGWGSPGEGSASQTVSKGGSGSTNPTTTSTTTKATSTTAASGGGGAVALWGQCGGESGSYTSTTCVAGAVCYEYSIWYSQCIPS